MAKKRRTELDVDSDIAPPPATEPEPAPAEEPPPPQEETVTEPEVKKNYVKLAIIAGLVILVVSITGTVGYGLYSKFYSEPVEEIKKEKPVTEKKPAPRKVKKSVFKEAEIYQFSPFLFRVGKRDKETLIQIDLAVEMSGAEVRKEINRNLVLIRENIYFLLSSRSLQTYTDKKMRRKMAVDVAIILNRSIQSGAVTKTLITGLTVF